MAGHPLIGRSLPATVALAEWAEDHVRMRLAGDLFGRGRVMIAGAPGAFTPVCSQRHIPDLIENADRLAANGVRLYCVVTSDPFSLLAWARIIDPLHKLTFLSDGNLAFARALGLLAPAEEIFMGLRSQRYALTAVDGQIRSARVERSTLDFACTRASDLEVID
jgi:glutaredoxin/glutathione-dependent peroxiredoxin